jgi:hypothetical protein
MTHRIRRLPSSILIIIALLAMVCIVPAALAEGDDAPLEAVGSVCAAQHLAHAKLRNHSAIPRGVADECVDEDDRRKAKLRTKASDVPVADLPPTATSRSAVMRRFASAEPPCNIDPSPVPHDYDPQGPPSDTV